MEKYDVFNVEALIFHFHLTLILFFVPFKKLDGRPIQAEFSPVTDFREARCRDFDENACQRGGFCNFLHVKPVPLALIRSLEDDAEADRRAVEDQRRAEKEEERRRRHEKKRQRRERDDHDRGSRKRRHRRSRSRSAADDDDRSRS